MEIINRLGSIFIRHHYFIERDIGNYDEAYTDVINFIKKYAKAMYSDGEKATILLKGKQIVGLAEIKIDTVHDCDSDINEIYNKIGEDEIIPIYIYSGEDWHCLETYVVKITMLVSLITDVNYEDTDEVRDFLKLYRYSSISRTLLRPM